MKNLLILSSIWLKASSTNIGISEAAREEEAQQSMSARATMGQQHQGRFLRVVKSELLRLKKFDSMEQFRSALARVAIFIYI